MTSSACNDPQYSQPDSCFVFTSTDSVTPGRYRQIVVYRSPPSRERSTLTVSGIPHLLLREDITSEFHIRQRGPCNPLISKGRTYRLGPLWLDLTDRSVHIFGLIGHSHGQPSFIYDDITVFIALMMRRTDTSRLICVPREYLLLQGSFRHR